MSGLAKILHDLWIITNDGIVLFSRVYNPKVETQLFGALLSAINSFAEEVSDGGLTNFELSNKQFILLKQNNLLFIATSPKKTNKNIVISELEKISDRFFSKYPQMKKKDQWDDDINLFSDFDEFIEDALEDPVKKFWKGF
ncbi:MAG: hypothetical protein BAJALOKI3v1_90091 [Promethearchaeota archaeon]|nr:MAG: hypothetical protein BAJALOKI3v1_90091 [Candidatus Lokiarchaeota archaeon]